MHGGKCGAPVVAGVATQLPAPSQSALTLAKIVAGITAEHTVVGGAHANVVPVCATQLVDGPATTPQVESACSRPQHVPDCCVVCVSTPPHQPVPHGLPNRLIHTCLPAAEPRCAPGRRGQRSRLGTTRRWRGTAQRRHSGRIRRRCGTARRLGSGMFRRRRGTARHLWSGMFRRCQCIV